MSGLRASFDLLLPVIIWAGGFFAADKIRDRIFEQGTDTGFVADTAARADRAGLALRLTKVGTVTARVRLQLTGGEIKQASHYSATLEPSGIQLTFVPLVTSSTSANWFEIRRRVSKQDTTGNLMFRWPAGEELVVLSSEPRVNRGSIANWSVFLDNAAADSFADSRRRERTYRWLYSLWGATLIAGLITTVRAAVKAGKRVSGPSATPEEVLDLLVSGCGGTNQAETKEVQAALRYRLAGHSFREMEQAVGIDPKNPQHRLRRIKLHEGIQDFSERLDAYIADFTRTRERLVVPAELFTDAE